jgi:5-enolpyruvylshikimate-3-phosphate synthase
MKLQYHHKITFPVILLLKPTGQELRTGMKYCRCAIQEKYFLKIFELESLQGDANIANWFTQFGVNSVQKSDGVLLIKSVNISPEKLIHDFIENPDVAQTMACLCVAKKIPFHFTGLKTLKIKETDRISALTKRTGKIRRKTD